MSIIAVDGIPAKFALMNVVKTLARTINGHFEALNFKPQAKGKLSKVKTCYLRLSEKLDPVRVIEKINSGHFPKVIRPYAYIPDVVPDLPLATKPKRIPLKLRRAMRLPDDDSPEKVLSLANEEILVELQCKYPGLYNLSKKSGHKLLEDLAKKISDRLSVIEQANAEVLESCFKLTQWYRRMHPHFGDFQLVLSTLHAIEDAAGTPRTQLSEKELSAPPHPYIIDNLPYDKVQQACQKYSERINKRVSEHLKNLKSEITETDTEDEIVRKKVREELKKMAPYLPMMVNQVVAKHFKPEKSSSYRIRIYGEPFLPSKDTMAPFLRRYAPSPVVRSTRMFNMLRFNVPPTHYASIMAMDGTVLNGAKLVIRSSDMPQYKPRGSAHNDAEDEMAVDGMGEEDLQAEEWGDL